jgi:hypothetical protein
MRRITEVLRLAAQVLGYRQSVGISASTVQGYLHRAQSAGVSWPLADDLDSSAHYGRGRLQQRGRREPDRTDGRRLDLLRGCGGWGCGKQVGRGGRGRHENECQSERYHRSSPLPQSLQDPGGKGLNVHLPSSF